MATTLKSTVDYSKLDVLEVLFEAIAKDLPDEHKLAWLVQLGRDEEKLCSDKEKFRSLLNTLEPEWVSHDFFSFYNCMFRSAEQPHQSTILLMGTILEGHCSKSSQTTTTTGRTLCASYLNMGIHTYMLIFLKSMAYVDIKWRNRHKCKDAILP